MSTPNWILNTIQTYDIGDEIEDFTLDSQLGNISLIDLINGKYCLIVTFGSSFEPVATTEIGILGKLKNEFEARNINVVAIGCDTVTNYRRWIRDIEELNSTKIDFPLLSDTDCKVLRNFGCARCKPASSEYKVTCFSTFLIDLEYRIRGVFKYSPLVGRNFYEMLRYYDGLQLSVHHRIVTPCNWGFGQDVLIQNDVSNEEASHMRFAIIKPYFRLASCPENEK